MNLDDLPTLRRLTVGSEQVLHLRDTTAYRRLCECLYEEGYDFPQVLSGVDMEYGLRSVLNLRRLKDHAEVTVWIDVPYDSPNVPSVSDLWGGVEFHEREAFDLLGIHFDDHPDLRRILLEDHWTTHPLRRCYDTGGYLIDGWQPRPWPDFDAIDREQEEARKQAEEAARQAEVTSRESPVERLKEVPSLNPKFAEKLAEAGIGSVKELASLSDDASEQLAQKVGLKSAAAVKKWREGAKEILARSEADAAAEVGEAPDLAAVPSLNPRFAEALAAHGIASPARLAQVTDEEAEELAGKLGLKSVAAVKKWREGARALVAEGGGERSTAPAGEEAPERELHEVRSLNPSYAEKLKAQGVATANELAALSEEEAEALAGKLGLKSAAAVKKWIDGAQKLLKGES